MALSATLDIDLSKNRITLDIWPSSFGTSMTPVMSQTYPYPITASTDKKMAEDVRMAAQGRPVFREDGQEANFIAAFLKVASSGVLELIKPQDNRGAKKAVKRRQKPNRTRVYFGDERTSELLAG